MGKPVVTSSESKRAAGRLIAQPFVGAINGASVVVFRMKYALIACRMPLKQAETKHDADLESKILKQVRGGRLFGKRAAAVVFRLNSTSRTATFRAMRS